MLEERNIRLRLLVPLVAGLSTAAWGWLLSLTAFGDAMLSALDRGFDFLALQCVFLPACLLVGVFERRTEYIGLQCACFVLGVTVTTYLAELLRLLVSPYGHDVLFVAFMGLIFLPVVGVVLWFPAFAFAWIGKTIASVVFGRDQTREAPKCRRCGYPLAGLTSKRCPECGWYFTYAELETTADELSAPPPVDDG